MKKIMMTRLSVCSLGVSCNEMIDTPMLLVVLFFISYFSNVTLDIIIAASKLIFNYFFISCSFKFKSNLRHFSCSLPVTKVTLTC